MPEKNVRYKFIRRVKIKDSCRPIRDIIENELKKREKGIIHGIVSGNKAGYKSYCGLIKLHRGTDPLIFDSDNKNITCDNCKKTKLYRGV